MEDKDALDLVVTSGLNFVAALTRYYGAEAGAATWEIITASLDKEARGAIMMAMLTGQKSTIVTIRNIPALTYIETIKAVRSATGYGLAETKNLLDQVKNGVLPYVTVNAYTYGVSEKLRHELRAVGCIVS